MKRLPENDGDKLSNCSEGNSEAKANGKQPEPAVRARREFLRTSLLGTAAIATVAAKPIVARGGAIAPNAVAYAGDVPAFELDETTISDLQDAMKSGKLTSRSITEKYLARIDQVDKQGPAINAILELNPDALSIADAMDTERKEKGPRGPLHGIPVLIKDNIDTADKMMTTAGSLALLGSRASKDSTVAQRLRDAGAVILGKTNLSEWANIRSNHSTSGWSGRGGQTKNPYALDRNPCGSSSGSGAAVSANLAAAAIGTETDGSIVCPSSTCGVAGIKPTVGLVSRTGIIPISHTQDTAGPMCRTLRDAAILLGALTGIDSADAATADSREHSYTDYTQFLKEDGMRGARIGVVRRAFGFNEDVDKVMEAALATMKKQGAVLVDPAPIETAGKFGESEFTIFLYELKADLNAYLAKLGPNAPVKTLKDIIDFNEKNRDKEMPYFGQDTFLQSEGKGPLTTQEYIDAVAKARELARKEGIDATMDKNNLDALVGPTGGPAWLTDHINGDSFGGGSSSTAAVAGYPNITVPAGFVHGLPVGISFFGRAWSEPVLLRVAYAFEQATKVRKAPGFAPTLNI
ncbi:MAG TPA: amidase [Candidatus Acidoferrum sp.]|nr:amidase [Candidatus Acidoferrum sp.]